MGKVMLEPVFTEFADACLSVIEPMAKEEDWRNCLSYLKPGAVCREQLVLSTSNSLCYWSFFTRFRGRLKLCCGDN
jgi:hypothetical protein